MKNIMYLVVVLFAIPLTGQIQLLNDEFNEAATLSANWLNIDDVEQWDAEHLESHDINSSHAGALSMMPWTSSWYQDYKGTLLFKNVEGDFVITTEVTATNRNENDIPGPQYSLAGIMIREERDFPNGALGAGGWTPGDENYVFLATGFAANNHPSCSGCQGPHFEVKNTINSNSNLIVSSEPSSSNVLIRVARIDSVILVLNQMPGGAWEVHQRYDRNDFSASLQVGFVTYTDWQKVSTYTPLFHNSNVLNSGLNPDPSSNPGLAFNPDLIGRFEFARFDEVNIPQELQGVDLFSEATDTEILGFLGYNSQVFCPQSLSVIDNIVEDQIAIIESSQSMTLNNSLENNADLRISSSEVDILPGFEMNSGAQLNIEVNGCTQ